MKSSKKVFSCALLLICMLWLAIFPVRARADSNDFTQEELDYIKENPVVITAIDPLFIPFEFIDIDGNYKGIAADYLKLIEVKTGLTFEILPDLTWPEAYNLALAGKVDLLPCVGATKERQENFLLTKSYLKYQRAVFSLVEGESYKFNDLDKITVGVQRNSSNYSFLVFEKKLNPVLYENNDSLLTALSEGEIEAAVANYSSAKYTIRQLGLNNIKVGEIQNSDTSELAMAVKKDNPVLQSILNKALAQISEEEKILISNKWLGIETEADYSDIYRYVILGLIVVAVIIVIFVLWNRSLKKLIKERKEAELRLKLLLESVGEGIIGIDTEGKVNFTNSKALDLLKYRDGELLGQPAHQMIHHTHSDSTVYELSECPMQKTYTLGETYYVYDEVLWRSDSSSFDAEYTSVPLIRDDRIEGAVIVFKDITERKRQQEETKKALEQVEKLYTTSLALRSTVNLTEVLDVILSSLKEIVTFNTASVQELKNDKFEIIYCDGFDKPDDVVGLRFACDEGTLNKQVLDKKTTVVISDVRDYKEFVDRTKGKKIRSFMAVPLAINDKIIGELSLCSFELDYYNAETAALAEAFAAQAAVALNNAINFKELGSAKAAAEEAAKAKGDFLANMSHEIRTPMNAIMGLLSLLSYTNLTPKQNDYVKKIDNASKSLLYIINDILDFSKIESGKLSVEKIEFKLDEVLSHLSDVLSLKAEAKGIEFIISKGELVPNGLIGDPLRLEQILLNLTNNAIKFTDQGEIIVKIIAEKQDKNEVLMRFSVIDSGIGMTEEQMTGLFSAFVQADASTTRKYGGTGLGLSISKNLVELMGGQIDAVSEYGKGSEFFFTCPFKLSMHPAECKTCIPVEVPGLEVMVVEDNTYARDVIDSYLKRFGLNVALVSCGEEALDEAVKYHFDLFIIDYKMPGINGVETWTKIKETSRINKQSKAILISSYSKYEILEEAKQADFTDILAKPLTQSILFDAIVNAFSSKEAVSGQTKTETQYPKDFEKIKGARILVVEDNEINQQVVKEILEMQGFFVELADNGKACVDRLSAGETYDLVFMDLQMPIMDGYTAARVLREKQGLKLPIIALSADAMEETVKAAKKAGMNGYVRKPIDTQVLFEVMAQHIEPKVRKRKPEKNSKPSPGLEVVAKKMLRNIDVDNGLGRFGGNTELYLSTLSKFVKNNQDFVLVLRGLVMQRKIQESKRMLHTMKGVSGNIGAVRLNRAVKECEQVISKDTFSEKAADIKLNEIDNELSAIFSQIDKLNNTSEVVGLMVLGTEMIDDSEMIKRLKALQELLKQYDTAAKEAFNDMKTVAFGVDEGRFNTMGEYIDNYDFDSATRLCGELIKEFKKRVSIK